MQEEFWDIHWSSKKSLFHHLGSLCKLYWQIIIHLTFHKFCNLNQNEQCMLYVFCHFCSASRNILKISNMDHCQISKWGFGPNHPIIKVVLENTTKITQLWKPSWKIVTSSRMKTAACQSLTQSWEVRILGQNKKCFQEHISH